jgi:glycosyltransferase involved in cell wall biosynthesis
MKIEAVIVCANYADFLAHSLPDNISHFDRIVVVTTHDDKQTQDLCRKFSVDCFPTDVFFEDGDKFNKGRAINYGLSHLRHDDWVVHIDADIVCPMRFRQMLHYAKLQKDTIYGVDRLNTRSYDNWIQNKWRTVPQHQYRFMITPTEQFPLGSRLLHAELGWLPIGYFQLWHSSTRRTYPVTAGAAEHSDVVFASQWSKRRLIPELFVYHLESEQVPMGANWQGRKTKVFGPQPKEETKPADTYGTGGA